MNYFTIIFNRVYFLLTKVKNQSPFLGTILLVGIMIGVLIGNVRLFIQSFNERPLIMNNNHEYLFMALIIGLCFLYAKDRRAEIMKVKISYATFKGILTGCLFIFTVVTYILLANINREKIAKQRREMKLSRPNKESLEGRIRKWLE